jgi:hypothetical protein
VVIAARSRPSRLVAVAPAWWSGIRTGRPAGLPGGVEARGGEVVGVQVDTNDPTGPGGGQRHWFGGGTDPADSQVRAQPPLGVGRGLDVDPDC